MQFSASGETVEILERERVPQRINNFGERIRAALRELLQDSGVEGSVSGAGSMFKIFFSAGGINVRNYADALSCDKEEYMGLFHAMLSSSVFLPPSQFETNFISFAHTEEDIERTIEAYKDNLAYI